jgi:peptidoglycan/xylan/chitin deacetylase (PgdA/CDA1 family)
MRYLTLSFDDGFRRSSLKTAELYEKHGLRAEFNVLAAPTGKGIGDFGLWNELQYRGHIMQPHGYNHTNKSMVPLPEAQYLIHRCLDIFSEKLAAFNPKSSIFNFPYNASTPELEAWMPTVVRAFRTGPGPAINPLPDGETVKLTTGGGEDAEALLDALLADLLSRPAGWLVYTAHGLDAEGWGPLRANYLDRLLGTLVERGDVAVLPTAEVLHHEG